MIAPYPTPEIQARENAHVNEQIRLTSYARELIARDPDLALDALEETGDLFSRYETRSDEETAELEARLTRQIREQVERETGAKIRELRAVIARVLDGARADLRDRAMARLYRLHVQAGEPLKLTAAQKRSEVWRLREEIATLQRTILDLTGGEPKEAKVIDLASRRG